MTVWAVCVCVCVTQHHRTMRRMAKPNWLTNVKCECGLFSLWNQRLMLQMRSRHCMEISPRKLFQAVTSAGPWWLWNCRILLTEKGFLFLTEGVGVSTTEAGLLTFRGDACIVLLSNRPESSCVRCITAARYATYGMEKSEFNNPGRDPAIVTHCVQSHPLTVQWQLFIRSDYLRWRNASKVEV